MLLSITIRNIALIEELTIPFYNGLHVLTGETGAGKSIVVDAVNLVLGGRADRDLIRTGCAKAYVEAVFDVSNSESVKALLDEQEIETDDGILTISREISQNGRNVCRVMGMTMQLSYLRQLTALLMDIHGQHEHQFLMDPKFHLRFLDDFGGEEHKKLLQELEISFNAFMTNHREYVRLHKASNEREQRMDMLRFQCDELSKAKLKAGEDEELQAERKRSRYAEKIISSVEGAYESIYGGSSNAVGLLRQASDLMNGIGTLDPVYSQVAERLQSLFFELEDIGITLRDLSEQEVFDPERAQQIEERLDQLNRLSRKYGPDANSMLEYLQKIKNELDELEALEDTLGSIQEQHRSLLRAYREKASETTQARKKLAEDFEKQVEGQLKDLGMGNTIFKVSFAQLPADAKKPMPTALGDDVVEFLIAPNPGEPLRSLAKIASGGELSRLMLAIKAIAAQTGQVDCMVFDEIDTGISGRMAQVVAEKMMMIACHRQVICVSHLPQIAAMADRQYLVEKTVHDGRTHTNVSEMDIGGRAAMIAKMIGGAENGDNSGLKHAKTMILAAENQKSLVKA